MLLQAMLMPFLGVVFYVALSRKLGSTGRYRFGYRRVALSAT